MSEAEVAAVMATIDEDGGGDIDLGEFTNWFLGLDTKKEGEKISKIGATQCRFVSRIPCARCASQLPPGDRPSSLPSPCFLCSERTDREYARASVFFACFGLLCCGMRSNSNLTVRDARPPFGLPAQGASR